MSKIKKNHPVYNSPDIVFSALKITLPANEQRILQKGLKFCPVAGYHNEFQLFSDLENFARTLRLQEHFHNTQREERHSLPKLRQWTPKPKRDKCLDPYNESMQWDILKSFREPKPFRQNISNDEQAAMNALSVQTDIIIKPADKGKAVVVLDRTDYLEVGGGHETIK